MHSLCPACTIRVTLSNECVPFVDVRLWHALSPKGSRSGSEAAAQVGWWQALARALSKARSDRLALRLDVLSPKRMRTRWQDGSRSGRSCGLGSTSVPQDRISSLFTHCLDRVPVILSVSIVGVCILTGEIPVVVICLRFVYIVGRLEMLVMTGTSLVGPSGRLRRRLLRAIELISWT